MIVSGAIRCVDMPPDAADWLDGFYGRFEDHGPDLADAAMVLLAERMAIETVFTLDLRDFAIYRTTDGRALRVVSSGA
jgi:predicted nucleic acid-binding protein